ncbi:MAG: helix-turn-helix domain-containing protein [Oscillospiraceae bacterium]|nr:helix-turn-helix domain-containing protein [Oscillospiraceae bacterium]
MDIENSRREFLTAGEITEFLGVSKSTYYKQKDTFPFRILRIGKKMFIPKQEFVEYMKREKQLHRWYRRGKYDLAKGAERYSFSTGVEARPTQHLHNSFKQCKYAVFSYTKNDLNPVFITYIDHIDHHDGDYAFPAP